MQRRRDLLLLHRGVEIQVRAGFNYESYASFIMRIDHEKIDLLSPKDERGRVVQIPFGREVTLSFTDMAGTEPKTYRTITLDQEYDNELEDSILTLTQPDGEPVSLRQFFRHPMNFRVMVQLSTHEEQLEAAGVDISGEGLQITMEPGQAEAITVGTESHLEFDIEGEGLHYRFKVDGEVVRSWEGHFDGKPAQYFGIRAHYDEDEQQAILQFILKDQIRRHSGLPEAASQG